MSPLLQRLMLKLELTNCDNPMTMGTITVCKCESEQVFAVLQPICFVSDLQNCSKNVLACLCCLPCPLS